MINLAKWLVATISVLAAGCVSPASSEYPAPHRGEECIETQCVETASSVRLLPSVLGDELSARVRILDGKATNLQFSGNWLLWQNDDAEAPQTIAYDFRTDSLFKIGDISTLAYPHHYLVSEGNVIDAGRGGGIQDYASPTVHRYRAVKWSHVDVTPSNIQLPALDYNLTLEPAIAGRGFVAYATSNETTLRAHAYNPFEDRLHSTDGGIPLGTSGEWVHLFTTNGTNHSITAWHPLRQERQEMLTLPVSSNGWEQIGDVLLVDDAQGSTTVLRGNRTIGVVPMRLSDLDNALLAHDDSGIYYATSPADCKRCQAVRRMDWVSQQERVLDIPVPPDAEVRWVYGLAVDDGRYAISLRIGEQYSIAVWNK